MKKTLFTAVIAAIGFAAPAMAWEGNTVACYDKKLMPATYTYKKHLVKDGKKQYEHRNGRIELVSYPPVYRQVATLKSGAHYVMRQVKCNH